MNRKPDQLRIAVVISGNGSNLQAIIDAIAAGHLDATICCVVSNVPNVHGLTRARDAQIPVETIDHTTFDSREAFDGALCDAFSRYEADVVVLAGFMRILSDVFFERWSGPTLNIHPALLPAYPGLNTHARVIADGGRWHGASVHLVIPELDAGPVIIRGACPVERDDTTETLAERVHAVEQRIYPKALIWLAAGRLSVQQSEVLVDGLRHPDQGLDDPADEKPGKAQTP